MPINSGYNAAFILMILFLSVLFIVQYVLSSIALYRMAVNRGIKSKAFLAWIPVGSSYLFGLFSRENSCRSMHIILPLYDIAIILVALVSQSQIINWFIRIIGVFISLYAFYGLLKCYDTNWSAGKHVVLSCIIPFYRSILMFSIRDWPLSDSSMDDTDEVQAKLEEVQDLKARYWRRF